MRQRQVISNLYITVAPDTRLRYDLLLSSVGPTNYRNGGIDIAVELAMQPANKIGMGRVFQLAPGCPVVDLRL